MASQVVVDAFIELQRKFSVCLIGYVIMPEHLHSLIYPHPQASSNPMPVSDLLQCFKEYVGLQGKRRLRDVWKSSRSLWSPPLNQWTLGTFDKQDIMNTRGYDRNIFTQRALMQKLDYCHKNPLTRGLVTDAADWHWSSYRFYELGDLNVLPMDWNGSWPIEW